MHVCSMHIEHGRIIVNRLLHVNVLSKKELSLYWEKVQEKEIESSKKRKRKANQLKHLPSYIHEEISNYNFKLVSGKIYNSGTLLKNDFWKIKK